MTDLDKSVAELLAEALAKKKRQKNKDTGHDDVSDQDSDSGDAPRKDDWDDQAEAEYSDDLDIIGGGGGGDNEHDNWLKKGGKF